ncbi:MAG: transglutaminase domain-containing protein, partial [Planctomycetota bacterium]
MTVFVNVFLVAISGFGQLKADSAKANQDADVVRGCLKADAQPAAMCLGEERDTDGDGLCDFQEIHKYLTDPTKSDTDSDGIGDGDWQERREYTYTVRTIIHFMPPFDRAALNDGFQDARVLEMRNDYIELEVIHYPLGTAEDIVVANPNWRRDYTGMTQYLKRGITTNWDAKMREDVLAELKTDGIDIDKLSDKQVVEQVSSWLLKKSRSPGDVFTTYYVHYAGGKPYVYPGLEGAFEREFNKVRDSCNWTIEEHFDYELLGKGMFYNKTHGTCTSVAVYLTTVLRAVGIPTRMIIVVPAVDASD